MMLRFLAINVHDAECISASGGKCNIVTFIFSAFLCGDGAEERGILMNCLEVVCPIWLSCWK